MPIQTHFLPQFVRQSRTPLAPGRVGGCRACVGFVVFLLSIQLAATAPAADKKITYDDNLAPIFRQRCSACHNPNAKKADLDVTSYSALMHGGSSGAAIETGDAESSYLFSLVTHKSEPHMPQKADKLPAGEIDLIRRWINGGALENSGSQAPKPKTKVKVAAASAAGKRPDVIPMPPRMVLEPVFQMKHPPMARSLAASPWAPLVAVASQRQVLLYNTTTLELVGVYPFPEGQPNVVRFSRDGRLLLAGGGRPAASGRVVVWDITTGERVFEVGKELDVVLAADISADHKRIALGGPQRLVRVYSTETGELQYEIAKHTDWVLALEFSPDGVLLATADRNGGLCVWETETGHEYLALNGHTAAVNAVSWRGDSNILASASEDSTLRLWEMENGTQVKNWNAKTPLLSADFTRDNRLVTCGRDQRTRIWTQDGKQKLETKPIGELAVSVAFADESHRAITANWSGVVQVYNDDKGTEQGTLVTNPPTLEERLAVAKKSLQQKADSSAKIVEAARKAEADASAAQTSLAAAQQKQARLKSDAEKIAAEIKDTVSTRAAKENERAKTAITFQQNESARPSVAEALRHLTEALGKLPNDAKLTAAQKALTAELKSMENVSAGAQTKLNELTSAINSADAKLKETNARLATVNKESTAVAAQTKSLAAETQKLGAVLTTTQKGAAPAEAQLAEAKHAVARWEDEIAFRDKLAALQMDLDAARKVAAQRQADLDKANTQLAAVQTTVNTAKSKVDNASHGVDAVMQKIQQARSGK